MELEIVETVLTEILQEIKTSNQLTTGLIEQGKKLEEKVDGFNQKLAQLKVIAPPVDTKPMEKELVNFHVEVCRIVAKQPKTVIRQVRILLFPETNAGQYYKIIFGRLIPWGLAFVVAWYLFSLGS